MARRRRFSETALEARLAEFGDRCADCGIAVGGAAGLEWDHVIPLGLEGADEIDNLEPLCRGCHRAKTRKDVVHIAKAKRMTRRAKGIGRVAQNPMPGSRASPWKRRINKTTVRRNGEDA